MKILCPTDFSHNAMIALEHAIYYTKLLEADLYIIYVQSNQGLGEQGVENLNQLLSGLSAVEQGHITPTTAVLQGNTATAIMDYAYYHAIDLIIMGTKGYTNLQNLLLGGVTRTLALQSTIPILAIPSTVSEEVHTSLVLALDRDTLHDESTFKVGREIAMASQSKIDILHIGDTQDLVPFDPFIYSFLGDHVGQVHILDGQDTLQIIKSYTEQNQVGVLMMVRRKHGYLHHLLLESHTIEELGRTNVPLLVLPEFS